MNFGQAIASGFRNYANFKGTARRSEYWWWALFIFLVSVPLTVFDLTVLSAEGFPTYGGNLGLSTVWALATLLPYLAVMVRRLRDAGYPWPTAFLGLIPFVGPIWLIVLLCQPSTNSVARPNQTSVPGTSVTGS